MKISILMSLILLMTCSSIAGTIQGKVNFEGDVPAAKKIKMNADPICAMKHDSDVLTQRVVVNDNSTLRHVLIYVKEGLGEATYEVPTEPILLNQKGCMYEPHIFGIQIGQELKILNSDDTLHNVHAKTRKKSLFNLAMPFKGLELKQKFENGEQVKFVCEVHPWMRAYAGVFNHPFFSVTGDDGSFEITGLPAGDYVIEAWHEKYKILTQNVSVGQDDTQTIEFTYKAE